MPNRWVLAEECQSRGTTTVLPRGDRGSRVGDMENGGRKRDKAVGARVIHMERSAIDPRDRRPRGRPCDLSRSVT